MSKSSIATTQKTLPSAWAKGPPPNTSSGAPTSRAQSPAPTNSTPNSANHSRRPSALGPGIPIKDGVSVPRNNMGAVKQNSAVSFGSIDDVSAPISSSPASTPAVKTENVKSFGTVANAGHVNGKPSISSAPKPNSNATTNGTSTSTTTSSIGASVSTPPIKARMDVYKLFQGNSSTSQAPAPDVASPSTRPTGLPPQHQSLQQSPQGQQPTPSQPPQLGTHQYSTFVPGRPPHPNSSSGRGPPGSPVIGRPQMANGRPPPPGGPNGPGGPQIPTGLSSPRLGHAHPHPHPHPHPGQPSAIPPPQQVWPAHYYTDSYVPFFPGWYVPPTPPITHQHHPHQHPHPPSGPPGQPHPGMTMSPRNAPMPLQVPGTPTQSHAVPPHPPHPTPSHSTANSGLSSPPPTPSTSVHGSLSSAGPGSARLNTNANAFIPRSSGKITIKREDGIEVDLSDLTKAGTSTQTSVPAPAASNGSSAANRKFVRVETEDARKKRTDEEAKQAKQEADEKEKAEKEQAEKAKEEEERAAEAKKRKEEEEKERQRQAEEERIRKEEEEKERTRKEAEVKERLQREEERLKREEEERLKKEEAERIRKTEEEAQKALEEAQRIKEEEAKAAAAASKDKEEGEVAEAEPVDCKEKAKDKESLRIDTSAASHVPTDQSRRRPGPLDLTGASRREPITPALPSALATARIIEDINQISYPEGIKSPNVELNTNVKDGKFRYDRDFLLQFMSVCREKPDMLPPLDAIGLEPSDSSTYSMSRGGSGSRRVPTMPVPGTRTASVGLGIGGFKPGTQNPFSMGNFGTPGSGGAGSKTSEERFAVANRAVSVGGGQAGMPFGRPSPMIRSPSQGGPGHPIGGGRTRSKRGEKRNEGNKVPGHQQAHGSGFSQNQPVQIGPGGIPLEPVAPLEMSANRWTAGSTSRKPLPIDPDSPELVDRKVKALLNKLTMEKFDSISDQIISWANKSEKEKDGRTLIQVIRLVFEKATDEAAWSEMYARLCRKMMEQISSKVQDDGIKNSDGKPIAGGQLFRKYLLNRCQEDFERGWDAKDAAAAAAVAKASEDEAAKAANDKRGDDGEPVLYSDEYYAAQKAKRRGLGLIKFIGELFKLQMLTERIMHECIKKLLGNVENPEEEEIESLCKLLTTVGKSLDTTKARAHMDIYFSRMKELTRSGSVSSRMQFMLQDIIELRDRQWVTRNLVAAPSTIAQVHEVAAKDRAAAEKESLQRQMSMSRGGSRRGGERGQFDQQPGADGWAVAGGSGPARPPSKAGDLSNFGKINKATPMTFGPSSVFAGKKDPKGRAESLTRTNSSSNMFSMLTSEAAADAGPAKMSRPPSRKTSVDLSQSGIVEPPQRKKLQLLPRSKPTEEEVAPVSASPSEEDEVEETGMSEADAKKKIDEDSKEFFSVRNLEEAEGYFKDFTHEHQFRLIDKLVSSAIESKEADAQLVGNLLSHMVSKKLCEMATVEDGFMPTAELLDDIAIDAPKAFNLMAIMMKGAGLDKDDERKARIAAKSADSDKLVALLS